MVRAWRESVFSPGRFFPILGRIDGLSASVLYYLALGILVEGVTLFWRMVLPSAPESAGRLAELLALGPAPSPLTSFLFSPLTLLFSLLLVSGVVHLLLLMFGGAERGFATTVRVLCFAYSPQLFAVVPMIGAVVGGIWMIVLAIIGLAAAHATSRMKSAAAVLIPLAAALLFVASAVFLLAAAGTRL